MERTSSTRDAQRSLAARVTACNLGVHARRLEKRKITGWRCRPAATRRGDKCRASARIDGQPAIPAYPSVSPPRVLIFHSGNRAPPRAGTMRRKARGRIIYNRAGTVRGRRVVNHEPSGDEEAVLTAVIKRSTGAVKISLGCANTPGNLTWRIVTRDNFPRESARCDERGMKINRMLR